MSGHWEQWQSWTFTIGNKAYRQVRPLEMWVEDHEDVLYRGIWPFRKKIVSVEGYDIVFKYDRGPATRPRTDRIWFGDEIEAQDWFHYVYNNIFIKGDDSPPKPPAKKQNKKKKPHLTLL